MRSQEGEGGRGIFNATGPRKNRFALGNEAGILLENTNLEKEFNIHGSMTEKFNLNGKVEKPSRLKLRASCIIPPSLAQ